jgi:outer membrane protein TolC
MFEYAKINPNQTFLKNPNQMNRTGLIVSMVLALIIAPLTMPAQNLLSVGICKDAGTGEFEMLSQLVKSEITALTNAQGGAAYIELNADWQPARVDKNLQTLLDDPDIDLVIALGYLSSDAAARLKAHPKPVIAATILDKELQGLQLQPDNSTGVDNFTFIPSMIKLKDDMRAFHKMFAFKHLAVVVAEPFYQNSELIRQFLAPENPDFDLVFIPVGTSVDEALEALPAGVDAAFVFPMVAQSAPEIETLFAGLNSRHIPSLSVSGTDYLEKGATVSFTPPFTFQQMARQVALRVLKVSEGTNLSVMPIITGTKERTPYINMAGLRQINKFPEEWGLFENAILVNVEKMPGEEMNLRQAIAQALDNNITGKITDQDLLLAEKDVKIAGANLLPQIEASGTAVQLSENLVEASMGQRGEFTVIGSASLKQVIYSDAAFANYAIKKLMAENQKHYSTQVVLDIVSDVSTAYTQLLFARNNLQIKNDNVYATLQNLDIAKAKEQSGEAGLSDVNRWVSELSLNKMDLNDAQARYQAAMYNLNELLNLPAGNPVATPDTTGIDKTIMPSRDILPFYFSNPYLTERYAEFLVSEMESHSPELQQLLTAAKIMDRQKSMRNRQLYLPEVALFGNADQAFIREGIIANPNLPIPPPPDDITWNAGVKVSIPVFEGGRRRQEAQRATIEQDKIAWQKEDLLNKLEKGIHSSVQLLKASYHKVDLSREAARAAGDNFRIVQDAYAQGMATVVQLIDAQNVMVRTKNLATGAYYQYMLDFINTERLKGDFTFLGDETAQSVYNSRLLNYLNEGE